MKHTAALANLPRDTRDTLFMLAVVALVLAPMAGELPWWCSLLAGALLLWRAKLAWRGAVLPSRWWRIGLLVLAGAALALSFKPFFGRDTGVALIVILLALKTLELRSQRDAFVLFFLSFFVMLTNFFYSQSLLRAGAMLLALLGLLTALVLAHMPVGRPSLWRAARTAGSMALLGAPIMVLLFMLFPRLAPLWGVPSSSLTARSGLSSEMTVGTIANLALDDSVAMRIQFDGGAPASSELYFRGPVLANFDGLHWRSEDILMLPNRVRTELQLQGSAINYQVTLEPNQNNWLLTLDAAPKAPLLSQGSARMTSDLQWLQTRKTSGLLRYRATSYTQFKYGQNQTPATLASYLDLPPDFNPRTLAWAHTLRDEALAKHASSAYVVQAALQRLRSGGFVYTLEPGVYGRDSADEFWFDRKAGFCEHIAAGFVILMRGAGVPARIITGYQGGELNPLDGLWTVRQSDAHAWAEVWLPDQGWVRVDPTAAVSPARTGNLERLQAPRSALTNAILGNVAPGFIFNLRASWDAANNLWNQWLLGYDQASQLNLLKNIGFNSPSWRDLIRLMGAIVLGFGLLFGLYSAWGRQRQDPWLRLLERARTRLLRAGLSAPSNATPRQLAELLQKQAQPSNEQQQFANWLTRLEALRYAPAQTHSQPKRQLARLQRELHQLRLGG